MNEGIDNTAQVERLHERLLSEAEASGYYLNPDNDLARFLIGGLITNEDKYGYRACPCRLASGVKSEDLDIICPCDYRDADLDEYGACYCALYVSEAVRKDEKAASSIPERRPPLPHGKRRTGRRGVGLKDLPFPVWRCSVCGYLCARERPPAVCPICKAGKERFTRFI